MKRLINPAQTVRAARTVQADSDWLSAAERRALKTMDSLGEDWSDFFLGNS